MTSSSSADISRVDPSSFAWTAPSGVAEGVAGGVRRVVAEASAADCRSPLNEATLLSLRHSGLSSSSMWAATSAAHAPQTEGEITGFALVNAAPETRPERSAVTGEAPDPVEVNLVVAPSARGRGVGQALAEAVLAAFPDVHISAWSHGNHPGAAALAPALGFDRVRDLWIMRRSIADELPPVSIPDHTVVRTFDPARDVEAILALNAEAFAQHPEQGKMTRADLERRMAEPWFDPAGFFLAERTQSGSVPASFGVDGRPDLLGFHWTKVHQGDPSYGEVYVVGVSPAAQGMGLGKVLTLTGLHHLRSHGLAEVILYVASDNAPAIAAYEALGFSHADEDTDVMYSR